MFVKKSWNPNAKTIRYQYHIAEGYWDRESKQARHRLLMNITKLPKHVIEAIDQSLKMGETVVGGEVKLSAGDSVRGAGLLAIYRAWRQEGMDKILEDLTKAERESMLAMVAQRILEPASKLSLKRQFRNTLLGKLFSKKRLDEDELYRVMDVLHNNFYRVQKRLQRRNEAAPVLYLYDVTSTYFEGRKAEDGEYGYSRDKRWDRHQVVVGLVCTGEGVPVAVEVWPGSTADKSTVVTQVKLLKEEFGIKKAVFVGDKGMYSETAIEKIEEAGFDYILSMEWRKQRKKLERLAPEQLSLFDRVGVVEWEEGGVRYVGCASEFRQKRAAGRREAGMEKAHQGLAKLAKTATRGRYYSWVRLREKTNELLKANGVHGLWKTVITPIDKMQSPEEKTRLHLIFEPDEDAVKRRELIEGKYVLETSLSSVEYPPKKVKESYNSLQNVERAFRHIKSYLKIRPINHHKRRRVRAHVLICFFAYYLVKKMELELRAQGETREVESLLRSWEELRLSEFHLKVGKHSRREWQWSLGEVGRQIKKEIDDLGWWRSIEAHRHSLMKNGFS